MLSQHWCYFVHPKSPHKKTTKNILTTIVLHTVVCQSNAWKGWPTTLLASSDNATASNLEAETIWIFLDLSSEGAFGICPVRTCTQQGLQLHSWTWRVLEKYTSLTFSDQFAVRGTTVILPPLFDPRAGEACQSSVGRFWWESTCGKPTRMVSKPARTTHQAIPWWVDKCDICWTHALQLLLPKTWASQLLSTTQGFDFVRTKDDERRNKMNIYSSFCFHESTRGPCDSSENYGLLGDNCETASPACSWDCLGWQNCAERNTRKNTVCLLELEEKCSASMPRGDTVSNTLVASCY